MRDMTQKDTFTKRINYEYNELDTIAEYLEEAAADGWELTSKTGAIWGFRRSNPRKVRFSVEVVDTDVTGDVLDEFIAFCEAGGWKHAFDAGNIQIFETEDMEAEPIHTDPKVKLELVHDRCKALRLLLPAALMVILGLMMKMAYFPLRIDLFADFDSLINLAVLPLLGIILIASMAEYLIWYRKAKKAVDAGLSPIYKRTQVSRILDVLLLAILFGNVIVGNLLGAAFDEDWPFFLSLVAVLAVSIMVFWILFPKLSAKYNNSKKSNGGLFAIVVIIVLVVSVFVVPKVIPDEAEPKGIPLTLEDLGICKTDEAGHYEWREASPFLMRYEGGDESQGKAMYYEIYVTDYEKVYDLAVKYWLEPDELDEELFYPDDIKEMYNYKEVDEPAFGAETVYYNQDYDRWLLLYPDRVIWLDTPEKLSSEQKEIIGEKLTGEL